MASPEQVAAKFGRLAAEYQDLPLAQVKESSLIVKTAVTKLAPGRLRGVGKKGAKLGVRYNVGTYNGEAKSLVYVTGPWHLIERDTRAHIIPALKGQKSSQRGAQRATKGRMYGPAFGGVKAKPQVIVIGKNVRAMAFHPGTQGKHPFDKGVLASRAAVKRLWEGKANLAIRRIF